MNADQIQGIVRAIIAAVGGYFVGKGVVDQAMVVTIGGAAATIITAVWSVMSKQPPK